MLSNCSGFQRNIIGEVVRGSKVAVTTKDDDYFWFKTYITETNFRHCLCGISPIEAPWWLLTSTSVCFCIVKCCIANKLNFKAIFKFGLYYALQYVISRTKFHLLPTPRFIFQRLWKLYDVCSWDHVTTTSCQQCLVIQRPRTDNKLDPYSPTMPPT